MKKALPIIIVVIVLAIVVGWVVARNNSSDQSSDSSNSTQENKTTAPTATNTVTIQEMAFSPANITVKKGTTVTWTNKDSVAHTVTEADDQTGPNSGDLANGKSYSFKYDLVGTYEYYCTIHSNMKGTVTVTE